MTNSIDYAAGSVTALENFGLTKVGVFGAVRALGSRLVGPLSHAANRFVAGPVGRAVGRISAPISNAYNTHVAPVGRYVSQGITNTGKKLDNAGIAATRRVLGEPGAQAAGTLLQGTGAEVLRQGIGGTVGGALIGGGLEAALADEGQRWDAFQHGAQFGALSGGAFGVTSGAMSRPFRNLRKSHLQQGQRMRGLDPSAPENLAAVNNQMNRGFFENIKDLATNSGPMGRSGSAATLGGQIGQAGIEILGPMAVLPASLGGGFGTSTPPPSSTPPTPLEYDIPKVAFDTAPQGDPTLIDPVLGVTLAGSAVGGATVGTLADIAHANKKWPGGTRGIVAKRLAPAFGSVPGAMAGRYLARTQWPDATTDTPEVEKLKEIDFDKLMRYYHKRDDIT